MLKNRVRYRAFCKASKWQKSRANSGFENLWIYYISKLGGGESGWIYLKKSNRDTGKRVRQARFASQKILARSVHGGGLENYRDTGIATNQVSILLTFFRCLSLFL